MKYAYEISQERLVPNLTDNPSICIYARPDDREKEELLKELDVDKLTLESALDPDEISRMEISPDRVLIIWKRPDSFLYQNQMAFEVSSFGVVLRPNNLTIIFAGDMIPLEEKAFQRITSLTDLVLRLFFQIIHHYLGHLKAIKLISREIQSKLNASMENRYLLQMFSLGEDLVYYHNALEANGAVLVKLRASAERIGFSRADIDMIDDLVIENQQACKEASIYTTVLSGLMDARGTIINNNMNVLLKNLTLINVVFLPLNLIASIGGMSEFSTFTHGYNWWVSYGGFSLAMILLGWLTWLWLNRVINKGSRRVREEDELAAGSRRSGYPRSSL